MGKMLLHLLKEYQPFNEQEAFDRTSMIEFIQRNPDYLLRSNTIAHITSSSIVVNEAMTHVLFAFHNQYQSWGWLGGHNDGDEDCLRVAMKETTEESGVSNVRPYDGKIFMIETIMVPNHIKKGKHFSDHLHLNITYLLIADDQQPLVINHDENSNVAWFTFEEAMANVSEPHMIPIYQKALDKITLLKR
jgi:ADP-ribose pyrophosphatase YjhB (NUDIX family)